MAENKIQPQSRQELLELIRKYDTAVFTTVSADGSLHSRPMALQEAQPDMDLWFVTGLDSAKVRDLEAHPRVNLGFYENGGKGYVSVSGRVRLNRDRARIEELWKPDWKLWFPQGKDDPDITLVVVEPEQAEYLDPATSRWALIEAVGHAISGTDNDHRDEVKHLDQAELRK